MAEPGLLLVAQIHYAPALNEAIRPALFADAVARRVRNFIWNLFAAPLDCHWPLPLLERHWGLATYFCLPDACALSMVSRTVHVECEASLPWGLLPILHPMPSFQQWQELRQVMHLIRNDHECPIEMKEFILNCYREHSEMAYELALVHTLDGHLEHVRHFLEVQLVHPGSLCHEESDMDESMAITP